MSQTLRRMYTVTNPSGLHMRPLQAFVEQANKYRSEVLVGRADAQEKFNGKSMIHLLGLGAEQGTEIFVEVVGDDAEPAMEALWQVLHQIYDEV
jgi:phosphotransferase system HPr (HPr) family protein